MLPSSKLTGLPLPCRTPRYFSLSGDCTQQPHKHWHKRFLSSVRLLKSLAGEVPHCRLLLCYFGPRHRLWPLGSTAASPRERTLPRRKRCDGHAPFCSCILSFVACGAWLGSLAAEHLPECKFQQLLSGYTGLAIAIPANWPSLQSLAATEIGP